MNVKLGETSRLAWLGIEADPLFQSDNLSRAYNRPSNSIEQPGTDWLMSKKAIISSLERLGFKKAGGGGSVDSETTPRVRRKRVVKKKIPISPR